MKIVVNHCYGGFSISLEAARFMAARGNEQAIVEVKEYDDKSSGKVDLGEIEKKYDIRWYGYGYTDNGDGYKRNDPDLVAAVETLGEKADGMCASLVIVDVPDDVDWYIDEYDGMEHVAERHRTW